MATPAVSSTTTSTSEVVIRELNSSVTTFSRPFVRTGCEVGVRMSAIKLSSGDLILYNPTELDAETRAKLSSLGTVRYIVAPNLVHHMFVAPYAKEFPNAKIIGPEGLQDKKKSEGVHFALEMKDPSADYSQQIGWGTDIEYIYCTHNHTRSRSTAHDAAAALTDTIPLVLCCRCCQSPTLVRRK